MAKQFTIKTEPIYETIAKATSEEAPAKEKRVETSVGSEKQKAKLPRINMAFAPNNYDYIRIMARASGKTMTDYVNAIIEKHKKEHEEQYKQALSFNSEI